MHHKEVLEEVGGITRRSWRRWEAAQRGPGGGGRQHKEVLEEVGCITRRSWRRWEAAQRGPGGVESHNKAVGPKGGFQETMMRTKQWKCWRSVVDN